MKWKQENSPRQLRSHPHCGRQREASTVLGNLLFAGLMLRVVGHSAGATGADGVNFLVSISFVV